MKIFPGLHHRTPTSGSYSAPKTPSCFSLHTRYARCSLFFASQKNMSQNYFQPPPPPPQSKFRSGGSLYFGVISSSTSYKGATEVNYTFRKYVEKLYRENRPVLASSPFYIICINCYYHEGVGLRRKELSIITL